METRIGPARVSCGHTQESAGIKISPFKVMVAPVRQRTDSSEALCEWDSGATPWCSVAVPWDTCPEQTKCVEGAQF